MVERFTMKALRVLANILLFVLLALGAYVALHFVIALAASLLSRFSFTSVLFVWDGTKGFLRSDAPVWLTAVATIALYYATRVLARSTNIQLAVDGPLLRIDLLDAVPDDVAVNAYNPQWSLEDGSEPNLRAAVAKSPRYLYLMISNQQSRPIGVAGAVAVEVALYFGAPSGSPPHPHAFRRTVRAELVAPNTFVAGPVLNVGTLNGFLAVVESVEYRDMTNRRRTAAWGTNVVVQIPGSAATMAYKIFEPRKGEYSDGHRG